MLSADVRGVTNPGGRASLSVCCLTRGPTARVAAQLALLRDVADEIVVAVDTSVDENLVHPLERVADVLVRYPYADPVDRPVGWVHSLCTRDWILWVDDDEIPSAGLLAAVPAAISQRSVTHCFVARRTLWRDAGSALVGPPWVPDFQLRLVQNDPRVVWFPGITHWPIQAIGPHRYLVDCLYHTDLLLSSVERRREKVRRYEGAVPGRRVAGLPMNDAYFLPEDRAAVRVAPIAEPDRRTVEGILALEAWPEPAGAVERVRIATRSEVDVHWHGAPAGDDLYRCALELLDGLEPFALGEQRGVVVRVTNLGTHAWPPGEVGWPPVRLSYRWLDAAGSTVVGDGLRTPLPAMLAPGESLIVPVEILAAPGAGRHTLVLDLLHEHVRWFRCEVAAEVAILPAPCVAILGEDEEAAVAAAAILSEVAPALRPLVLSEDPERTTVLRGYPAKQNPRSYVLEGDGGRGRVGAIAGAVGRAAALLGDAALRRAGARPRLAAPAGSAFLDALYEADMLLVVGDGALRGGRGEREALQQRAALLAARTLGLETVVLPRDAGSLRSELAEAVRGLEASS